LEIWAQSVVCSAQSQGGRVILELHRGFDHVDLAPVDANSSVTADPAGEAADPAGTGSPVAGPDENRDYFGGVTGAAFDREVINVAAPPTVLVDELMVEDVEGDVELSLHQFCPAFVMIISGT